EVLARRLPVLVELDLAIRSVQVQHRVERVEVALCAVLAHLAVLGGGDGGHAASPSLSSAVGCSGCCGRSRSRPSRTASTSRGVPNSSTRYRCGTWHLAATTSPAKQ